MRQGGDARGWLVGVAIAGLLTNARAAHAEPEGAETVRLVWIRGPGADACQDRVALTEHVDARLGRRVFSDSARRSIEGFVQREGDRWVVHVYARDADGRLTGARDLANNAVDCTGLDAAVTLAVALVIDPAAALARPKDAVSVARAQAAEALVRPPPPPPAPPEMRPAAPCPLPSPTPVPRPAVAPTVPPRPSPGDRVILTGQVLVTAGLVPGAAPGFAISADVPVHAWLDVTTGAFFLPEARTASGDFGFGLTAAWAGVCAVPWRDSRVALSLCGDLEVGAIHAVVYAFEPTQPGDRVWSGAEGAARLRFRVLGPVVVVAGLGLVVPLTRQPFIVQGQANAVFQEYPVAAVGFIALGASIP